MTQEREGGSFASGEEQEPENPEDEKVGSFAEGEKEDD